VARLVEITAPGAALSLDGLAADEPGWIAPRPLASGTHSLVVDGASRVVVASHGAPVESVLSERSLTWVDPLLLDDRAVAGLGRLMPLVARDGHGGALFESWLRRFGTTAHSERLGPSQLADAIAAEQGTDATRWDLDALPFVVTAVHNRLDLAGPERCGELRVSLGSVHDSYQPFHLIFLFAQAPLPGDRSPGGRLHCAATARRWARLSEASDFHERARALLDEALVRERFLIAETAEFITAPWEWRQWLPNDDGTVLDNPPLFQAVDIPRLNAAGPDRTDFLAFVAANAAALDARELLLPERFRSPSARANAGVPWVPLNLDGLDASVASTYPQLRQHIEIVGCPACHAIDGDFVQTRVNRTFSPFYEKELPARADFLVAAANGELPRALFGPLQSDPVLAP
jgi:hypothetical protein